MDTELLTQGSKRREAVDCFNCSVSRRQCDRTRHRCEACTLCSEACSGYPREWQWLAGVKSRGKHKGQSMSIAASSREWQSTTPVNHMFVFKQSNPKKKRAKCAGKSPKPKPHNRADTTDNKKASLELSGAVVLSNQPQSQPPDASQGELPILSPTSVLDISPDLPLIPDEFCDTGVCDVASFGQIDNIFDGFDFPMLQDFDVDGGNMLMPSIQIESIWPEQAIEWTVPTIQSPQSPRPATPRLSSSPISDLQTSELLTLYDAELCVLPLTFDYESNPLRFVSHGSEHSVHAVLAFCMQYLIRSRDPTPIISTSEQVTAYRHSATKVCAMVLPAVTIQHKQGILDTTVALFNLDSLTSATGPWNERLTVAFQRIESMGGLDALPRSPRFHGQLTMFVWWDCNISLFTRTEPVFPAHYHEYVIEHDNESASHVFALSGMPKELFSYFRELASLASEKEQISKMKYATFDNRRVLELERCIRDFTLDEAKPESGPYIEERVHTWYDYYHGTNAWKYGLLLYITRVLKWDRDGEPCRHEIASLSRLVLDSVRSCRADARVRKQFLHPVFLAAAESSDAYSRKFVAEYFVDWYRWCKYNMFEEALELLREVWDLKDKNNNDARIWWGSVVGERPPGASEFLLA